MSQPYSCPECSRVFQWGKDADSYLGVLGAGGSEACGENAYWKLQGHMQSQHPDAGFMCPRRGESPTRIRGNDWWGMRDGHRVCSYCGSSHPDDVFKAIEAGLEIGPTDKSYKIYLDLPSADPAEMRIISAISHDPSPGDDRWQRVTDDNRDRLRQQGWGSDYRWFWERPQGPTVHAKFYFQHLSKEQMQRFVDLYNDKTMKIGMPGYFYVSPFFMRPRD